MPRRRPKPLCLDNKKAFLISVEAIEVSHSDILQPYPLSTTRCRLVVENDHVLIATCLRDRSPRCMHHSPHFLFQPDHTPDITHPGRDVKGNTAHPTDIMAGSAPSPSDTSSSWSSSPTDSDTSILSNNTTFLPIAPAMARAEVSLAPALAGANTSPSTDVASPASCNSPAASRGPQYAQDADWARLRDRITALYEHRTLEEVRSIMKTEHNFWATARMYKSRFREWRVKKNVTASDVHVLLRKVEKHVQQAQPGRGGGGPRKTTVLDVGDEVDVKRIQKYMKRNPTGLSKLRADPKRPLDVIKALSVDEMKGRTGRAKVSIPTAKLEHEQRLSQFQISTSPSPNHMIHWPPHTPLADCSPVAMARLLSAAIDQELGGPCAHSCCAMPVPPTAANHWQSLGYGDSHASVSPISTQTDSSAEQINLMFQFVIKFRFAHFLLNDGLTTQAYEIINICLHLLSSRLEALQGADGRAICSVLLFAVTAALEAAVSSCNVELVSVLLRHIGSVCIGQQPMVAEFASRLSELGRHQQISMLKLARRLMCVVARGETEQEDMALEMYSRTVDIFIGQSQPEEKLRALQAMTGEPCVQMLEDGPLWMEARVAQSVPDAPWAAQQQGLWSATSLWTYAQQNKTAILFGYIADRMDCHKAAGDFKMVERWAAELTWISEIVMGSEHEVTQKFREEANNLVASVVPIIGPYEELGLMSDVHDHVPSPIAPPHPHAEPHMDSLNLSIELNLQGMSFKEGGGATIEMGAFGASESIHDLNFKSEPGDHHSGPDWEQTIAAATTMSEKRETVGDMTLPSMWELSGDNPMSGSDDVLYNSSFGC